MAVLILLALFLTVFKPSVAQQCEADNEETYSYHGSDNGPNEWPALFPACNGKMQSPIDIQTENVQMDDQRDKLTFLGYDDPVKEADVINNGHTVMITPRDGVERSISVSGEEYKLQQVHFHWGSVSQPGSEHTLNNQRFEMEAHFVHLSSSKEIAVVGSLVKMAKKNNKAFKPIVEILADIPFKDDSTELASDLSLNELLPESPASYYTYSGSLTTPMCTEGVVWFVLKDVQEIGWRQLNAFLKTWSVKEEDCSPECLLPPNNRPLQDLNSRTIYASP